MGFKSYQRSREEGNKRKVWPEIGCKRVCIKEMLQRKDVDKGKERDRIRGSVNRFGG